MILGTVPIRGIEDIWKGLEQRKLKKGQKRRQIRRTIKNSTGLNQPSASMRDLRWDGRMGFSKHPTKLKC